MIEALILNTFLIQGLKNAYKPLNVLSSVSTFLIDKTVNTRLIWLVKPLVACGPCMASVYGLAFYWSVGWEWYLYPIYVVILSGIQTMKIWN